MTRARSSKPNFWFAHLTQVNIGIRGVTSAVFSWMRFPAALDYFMINEMWVRMPIESTEY